MGKYCIFCKSGKRKKKKDKEAKKQVSYYICTKILGAKELCEIIQGHWGVENKVNYVKDVEFKEDKSRIRVKPGIFSRLRGASLNEMRINGAKNTSQERFLNCLNVNFALNYKDIA